LEVLKGMRATVSQGGLFVDESLSRDLYGAMFDTEVARLLAHRDQEGVSRIIERAIPKSAPASGEQPSAAAPIAGPVSAKFGPHGDPVGHRPIVDADLDIRPKQVSTVRDVRDGDVGFRDTRKNDGNIQMEHGSGIAHNLTKLVNTNHLVWAETTIAIARSTGNATGSHVDLKIRQDDKRVDPARALSIAERRAKLTVA
jgi:murein DD-endopeptidase MepM/ murein hydrolase activator NlpD